MARGQKPERKWGWLTEQAPWEDTLGAKVLTPALDFVVRTCEIILLTGAFQAAAIATNNNAVKLIAQVMFVALGAHLTLAYLRYVLIPILTRPKNVTLLKFTIAIAIALSGPFFFSYLQDQVTEAAKAIATTAEVTTV